MTKSEQYYQELMKNDKVWFTVCKGSENEYITTDDDYKIYKNNNGTYDITVVLSEATVIDDWEHIERNYNSFTKDGIKEFIKSIESIDD